MSKKLPPLTEKSLEDIKQSATHATPGTAKSAAPATDSDATSTPGKSRRPAAAKKPATLKLSKELEDSLRQRAEREGMSVEDYLNECLDEHQQTTEAHPDEPGSTEMDPTERARRIVNRYAKFAIAGGAIPIPWLDTLATGGVQIAMLRELANVYQTPFSGELGKSIVSALVGSITPSIVSWGSVGSVLKLSPGAGTVAGMISMSALASAATWALGQLFIQHFEAGGTLLNFDPRAMRAHFRRLFEEEQKRAK